MSDNERNTGLATIVAFFAGFTAGAVLGLLYALIQGRKRERQFAKFPPM